MSMLDTLRTSRNLLLNLVRRDLTVRYKATVLGFFWSFIKPLALTAIFYVVFDAILHIGLIDAHGQPVPRDRVPFALHLLTGVLVWTFFAGATTEGLNAVRANANLIKKIRLPLAVFPLAVVCAHLVHFMLALLVLVLLLSLCGLPPTLAYLWLPPLIALQFVFVLAVTMTLAALNVFYKDVASIWEVALTAWFYATPIVYPVYLALDRLERLGAGAWQWLYLVNPMAALALAYRRVLIYASADLPAGEIADGHLATALAGCVVATVLALAAARRVFDHYARHFADEL